MTARRIAFFTSTRAEYGLLRPVMAEVASRPGLSLQTIVAGTHLSEEYGETWREIAADGLLAGVATGAVAARMAFAASRAWFRMARGNGA